MRKRGVLLILILTAASCTSTAKQQIPATQPSTGASAGAPSFATHVEVLIDQLQNTNADGLGYSTSLTGSVFLPYPDSTDAPMGLMFQPPPTSSITLEAIVRQGATAIPILLQHLDDARPCKIPPVKGIAWTMFNDEYDYNSHTRHDIPPGVNLDDGMDQQQPEDHIITIGDLCFVALGQIVNRSYAAMRYQPTGGIIISSPTYSAALRSVVHHDFDGFTVDRHRQMLTDDLLDSDNDFRRVGAYQRLAFYYPGAVGPLVVKELPVSMDRARFIRALTHDRSKAVDAAVYQIFIKNQEDDDLVLACFGRLVGRGYDEEIRAYCVSHVSKDEGYQDVLTNLNAKR